MKVTLVEGAAVSLAAGLSDPSIITFALAAHANDYQLSSLVFFPSIISAVSMQASTFWISKFRSKLSLLVVGSLLQALIQLTLALTALFHVETPLIIITCVTVAYSVTGITVPVIYCWLDSIVAGYPFKGRYFGIRSFVYDLISAVGMSIGATVHHSFPESAYFVLFAGSCVFRVITAILFAIQEEPEVERLDTEPQKTTLVTQGRNLSVWMIAAAGAVSSLAFGLVYPFFAPFITITLGFDTYIYATTTAVMASARIFANPVWGAISDKIGVRRALRIALVLAAVVASLWAFFYRAMWYLMCVTVATGLAIGGVDFLLFCSTLEITHGNSTLVSRINGSQLVCIAVGSMLGSALLSISTTATYAAIFAGETLLRTTVAIIGVILFSTKRATEENTSLLEKTPPKYGGIV